MYSAATLLHFDNVTFDGNYAGLQGGALAGRLVGLLGRATRHCYWTGYEAGLRGRATRYCLVGRAQTKRYWSRPLTSCTRARERNASILLICSALELSAQIGSKRVLPEQARIASVMIETLH